MGVLRLTKFFLLAITGVRAVSLDGPSVHVDSTMLRQREEVGPSPGNVAACYAPFHNQEYPLTTDDVNITALREAIDEDFRIMSLHFTHVRTYYAQNYGIEIAPIAAKYGVKLFLGVFLTTESWDADETNAAVNAIKNYTDTVEVVSVGNENLQNFNQRSSVILAKINEIKKKAGADAGRVKYGTVQRVTEFLESKYDWEMQQLSDNLDVLGVNIYPFFDNTYDGNHPTKQLDALWNLVVNKYPRHKIVLTETGFPTAGKPSSLSPNVMPGVDASVKYYDALVNWSPPGDENKQKYWFQAFDRRPEDPMSLPDFEQYFGFFTIGKTRKQPNYPRVRGPAPTPTSPAPVNPSCTIEEGVDYSGSDITNSQVPTAEGCFPLCNRLAPCRAFTWTPYQGGTCWFKSSKVSTIASKDARSGIACVCNNARELVTGVDYTGTDFADAPGATASACFAVCEKTSGCMAFSWTTYNGGTCWLKHNKGEGVAKEGVVSGAIC